MNLVKGLSHTMFDLELLPWPSHQGFKRYRADMIVCLTLNCHLDLETWTKIRIAHWLIILDICAQLFVNPTRGSKEREREWTQLCVWPYTLTLTFNWPWPKMGSAHHHMVLNTCARSFLNVTNPSRVNEQTHKTAIQCLTLRYDLDLESTWVKHMHCTSLIILDICAELFVNPTRDPKVIEQKR